MDKRAEQFSLDIQVPAIRHYYVDEAGDPVLFNRRGKVIVGNQGCSSHFFLGLVSVFNPAALESDLIALHRSLLADPNLPKRSSFLPVNRKTFLGFHATDDLPQVRELVFSVLMKHHFKFFAVVKDKRDHISYVLQKQAEEPSYRYGQNDLYDTLVNCLFFTRLHKPNEYNVYFAGRGPADRTAALKACLLNAQQRASILFNSESPGKINIFPPASPLKCINLQVTDYCLWALQRFYSRGEDKFLQMIWPCVSMIYDLDAMDGRKIGVRYTQKNPFGFQNKRPEI